MISPDQLISVLLAATLGALIGAPLALIAARRTVAQPVEFDTEREATILAWVLHRPANIVKVLDLEPDHFASRQHASLWAAIKEACANVPRLDQNASDEEQAAAAEMIPTYLVASVTSIDGPLVGDLLSSPVEDNDGLNAAQFVFDSGRDRITYPGHSPIERGNDGEPALVRRYKAPKLSRYILSGLLGAAAGGVIPLLSAELWPTGTSYWLAVAALVTLSVGSIIWALVDQDTMLIDLETFFPLAALAWLLTLAADFVGGEPRRALSGFLLSLGIAVFFRILNAGYRSYKQATTGAAVDGMGGGDSWLVIATAGVPAALAGQVNLWYLCAMAGMVAAIAVWLVRWPTPWRIRRNTPFAFGPYLALGWILGSWAFVAGFQVL